MSKTCPSHETNKTWPMVRLGDVCEVRAGANYKDVEDPNGRYPIYGTGGIMGRASQYRCPAHSVIVGRKGTLDNPFLVHEPFWNIDTCFGVVPSGKIVPEYLFRFCQGFDFYSLVPASGRPSTTSDAVRSIEIPLPPLSVQREIVARLERELAAVEKMKNGFEALAETAKAEFKAELKEVFEEISRGGAETRRLGDTFRFIDYRGMTPNKIATGVPLITAKNIRFGYMDYRERFYISEEDYAKRQTRGVARCGDILFTTEAPMGYVALADQKRFSTGQRIITFQWPNATEHNNRYFLYYFMSDVFQNQVRENASGATAQGIKSSRLVNLSVLIPECQKQSQVVARLDSAKARADKLEAKVREGVVVCETMRKAILKEAFE